MLLSPFVQFAFYSPTGNKEWINNYGQMFIQHIKGKICNGGKGEQFSNEKNAHE